MNILKKILLIVVVFLSALIVSQTTSKAQRIPFGTNEGILAVYEQDHGSLKYDMELGTNYTFCVQHGQHARDGATWHVQNYIKIEGRTCKIYRNNSNADSDLLAERENDENLILAWILNQGFTNSDFSDYGDHKREYSDIQKAVYGFFPKWVSANGYTTDGTTVFPASGGGEQNLEWENNARNYVNSWKSQKEASIKDNTNKNNLTKEIITYSGTEYIKVGPFNWTYTGTFNGAHVYDQNNREISASYGKYNGTTLQVFTNSKDACKSGQDFYVLIPANQGVSKINKVSASVTANIQNLISEIWTLRLEHPEFSMDEMQTLITTDSRIENTKDTVEIEINDIELFGGLIITKTDKDTGDKLANVGFRLKMVSGEKAGQYVSVNSNGNAVYSSSPTDMKTDANGQLVINGLHQGTYELTETTNPNQGYSSTPVVITDSIVVNPGQNTTQNVTNEKVFANLLIRKTDKDSGERLSGIGFTLQMLEGEMAGKYVSIDADGNAVYVDSPVNLMTDENGEIYIKNLYKGKYELIETVNPYFGYDDVPHLSTNNLIIDGGEERTLNVTNTQVYGGLVIEKTDKDTGETLSNIGFTIQMKDGEKAGQYVSIGSDTKAVYSSTPTTIYTDENGRIEINNMYPGTYEVVEVENPYFYYADTPLVMTSNLKITAGEKLTYDMENEKVFGKLVIVKTDKDTGEILSNIGFTIQMKDGEKAGQYVSIGSDTKADYSSTPTTIYTDENGRIEINNMYPGTYEVVETENPYDFYENTPFVIASDVRIEVGEELNYDMKNEKIYGNLEIVKTDEDSGEPLPKLGFTIQMLDGEKAGQYVSINDKGKAEYSSTPTTIYTDENGKISIKSLYPGTYEVVEVENPYYGYERVPLVITSDVHISIGEITNADLTNKMVYGKLKITKTDVDTGETMSDVGFTLQMLEGEGDKAGQYVSIDENGEAVYSTTPTTIYTDENGEINISYIYIGTYELIETENPHFGYEDVPKLISSDIVVTPGETVTNVSATNKREYVKVSGYAWEDRVQDKTSVKDNLWNENTEDRRLQYVTVRLVKADGTVLATTVTDENGEYIFGNYDEDPNAVKIRIDDLTGAYVEFEYNGMSYQTIAIRSEDNGNKATDSALRSDMNNEFATIVKDASQNTNGQNMHTIRYNRADYKSTVIYGDSVNYGYEGQTYPISGVYDQYVIQAITTKQDNNILCTTDTADSIRKEGKEEITNINLGVEEREMPDLNVAAEDVENVQIMFNNYKHTYEYGQVSADPDGFAGGDVSNVGVRFASKYIESSYTRAIYTSDIVYNINYPGSLQVYVTYSIRLVNEATTLDSTIKSIANYYDNRYTIVGVGTGMDDEGNITGSLNYTEESYNSNGYSKATIYTEDNARLEAQTDTYVYIRYQMNNDAINDILNERATLNSITEITSYSSYTDESFSSPYAGIDLDSAPDNATPGETTTYEDDTNWAPSLVLEVLEGRVIKGTVWEDSAINELLQETDYNKQRVGNGQYEEGTENVVNDVKVDLMTIDDSGNLAVGQLYKKDGSVVDATAMTTADDEGKNGSYTFSGVVPGKYVIRYTYGDNSVICDTSGNVIKNVVADDYKSTIYRGGKQSAAEAMTDYWYRGETSHEGAIRLSDAKDDEQFITQRTTDEEINYGTVVGGQRLTEIFADTRQFEIKIDYDVNLDNRTGYGIDLKFVFDNIDFGIIERPKQYLILDKQVANVDVTLANGVSLINGDPRTDNLSYVRLLPDGTLHIEVDNEIIQGATLRLTYEISVDNTNCEIDYNDEFYYIYGTIPSDYRTKYKIATVVDMYDYLPEDIMLETTDSNWEKQVITEDLKGTYLSEEVYEVVKDFENVVHLANPVFENMEPGKVESTTMVVSRQLSVSNDDMAYENDVEIVELKGRRTLNIETGEYDTPGNYDPVTNEPNEPDDDSVGVIITGPTGEDRVNYIIYIVVGIGMLILVGAGVVVIKKFVIKK